MGDVTFHEPHPLPRETHDCWLIQVKPCKYDPDFYTYILGFSLDSPYSGWRAVCHVPSHQVGKGTQRDLQLGREVHIEADEKSWARCTFKDMVGEDERRREAIRALTVVFNKEKFAGYLWVPSSESVAQKYLRLINMGVEKSIEPKPPASPPRRTVEFLGPIRANSKVRTEVWSIDGESMHRGGAKVLELRVEGGRRYLTIEAPVDVGEYAVLVGDVCDTNWARCGRFQEVDDPDTKASAVFNIPPWEEQE